VPDRQSQALRVAAGVLFMTGTVVIAFALVLQYAGGWGVPYFGFTTDRGSACKNTLTGHTCEPLTLADVEYYSDLDLPPDTRVISGVYRATHDYELDARLRAPPRSAAAALRGLQEAFGPCQPGHPSPLDSSGVTGLCVLANDDAAADESEVESRLYVVGTGLRRDGSREIVMSVKSR